MKVVAFNGSPRSDGNTAFGLRLVCQQLENEGITTEIIQLGGRRVFGCRACFKCAETKDRRCIRKDDEMNELIAKAFDADGIIIGSPVYFSNVSTEVKAFIDRCGFVSGANGGLLRGKIGGSVIAVRRAGSTFAYSAINLFFGITEMIVPASSYWNMTLARDRGDAEKDEEGIRTFETLGRNMARVMKKMNSGEDQD